ncbi:hypothetical protein BDW02DRAFT_333402 [Decorospora gaudefroyi]|uniref:Uncharacterized protein n=1 Tax=Decorospora gaudefroyi TaxID=184978 RepID=A0A6A5JW73_9PLEO|nr:hypothetical protein BDW02DRAFT_333402 [Decorospora gaudefroyi]
MLSSSSLEYLRLMSNKRTLFALFFGSSFVHCLITAIEVSVVGEYASLRRVSVN